MEKVAGLERNVEINTTKLILNTGRETLNLKDKLIKERTRREEILHLKESREMEKQKLMDFKSTNKISHKSKEMKKLIEDN